MLVEWDTDRRVTYLTVSERPVDRTMHFGDVVSVDVDDDGQPVGIEIMLPLYEVRPEVLHAAVEQFPELKNFLPAYF